MKSEHLLLKFLSLLLIASWTSLKSHLQLISHLITASFFSDHPYRERIRESSDIPFNWQSHPFS